MSFDVLRRALIANPRALFDGQQHYSGCQLLNRAEALATSLREAGVQRLGLLMDNTLAWVVTDLAAMFSGIVLVPLPGFFSDEQRQHVILDAGLDAILAPIPLGKEQQWLDEGVLTLLQPQQPVALPAGTAKVTYTSGTTGSPKGVCLSLANQLRVAEALVAVTGSLGVREHLCLLPLAVLLENIGGLYVPWLAGACVTVLPMSRLGMSGASGVEPQTLLSTLSQMQPHSLILVPALLPVLLAGRSQGVADSYRFLALGGGKTAIAHLEQAQALGLPVYEGYGLSESASVVALNAPDAQRLGTVGRPLQHVQVKLASDGEVLVKGNGFLGYLGQNMPAQSWLATGDIGELDAEGFLTIRGRKKDVIVTAMGRNVSPQWLESELCAIDGIKQAFVFGDEVRGIAALVVGQHPSPESLRQHINQQLPDYARLNALHFTEQPFSIEQQELTANGRLRRATLSHRIRSL